jgi:hypothetical protein
MPTQLTRSCLGCARPFLATLGAVNSGKGKYCGLPCQLTALHAGMVTHGAARADSETPEYTAWRHMRERCSNPRDRHYPDYGGRGISVCAAWRESFEKFLADVGPRPGPGYSIDRIDNDGHYKPGNVRWATRSEQARNRRNNRIVTLNGESRCLADWCRITGLSFKCLQNRLNRGWPVERALMTASRLVR